MSENCGACGEPRADHYCVKGRCGEYEPDPNDPTATESRLRAQVKALRSGLEGIAKDPHCQYPAHVPAGPASDYADGVRSGIVDGHRCAAQKARNAIAAADAIGAGKS